jgi:hypothetical protein
MAMLNILPECYVDTKVTEIITRSSEKYNHQHGCGQIANQLKYRLKDILALGIIDEDKNKGPVAKYFLEFEDVRSENGLILKKHKERQQYLILICPEIENWLLTNASSVQIDPLNFNLPKNLKGFKQITKTQNIDANVEFYRFIKSLVNNNSSGIITLRNWINAFRTNTIESLFIDT